MVSSQGQYTYFPPATRFLVFRILSRRGLGMDAKNSY